MEIDLVEFRPPVVNKTDEEMTLPEHIELIEKQRIIGALAKFKTQRAAAKALGITERMLGYKIKNYNIIKNYKIVV
jgi:transcriptional regulator with GAF, ATPase, and Fis domain